MTKPPSTIRIDGDTAFIFLKEGFEAAIDLADIPLVADRRWRLLTSPKGHIYVCAGQSVSGNFVTLHRHLMQPPRDRYVDHEDGDGLNNRRGNLRIASGTENNANSITMRRNRLGYKGVHTKKGRFCAHIKIDGRTRHLGYFDTPEEASAAYLGAAKVAWGDFAKN